MNYTTIIFDLDGTLLDTLEDLADSVNFMLSQLGCPPNTREQVQNNVGNGISRLIELSLPNVTDKQSLSASLKIFKDHYIQNCANKTKPYPHIIDLLKTLKNKGIKMAVVSNKSDYAVKKLNDLFFKEYIEVALGEVPGIPKKPAPDLVELALKRLDSKKNETLYVGDSDVDVKTAHNTGIKCVSVSWGYREAQLLLASGADTVIDTPETLLGFL